MHVCKGGGSWKSCGRPVRYVRASFCVGNIALDLEPSSAGDVVIEHDMAVVLSRESAADHPGPRYTMHVATCPAAAEALGRPIYRGGAHQSTKLRPAFEMGEFDSRAEAALASIEAGQVESEVDRLTERFLEHLRGVRGARAVYDYAEVNETFNSFRRLYAIRRDIAEAVAAKARRQLRVATPEAA